MNVILVNFIGIGLITLIVWYFWLSHSKGQAAAVSRGIQEARIIVKGGYAPDTIELETGVPARLVFNRQESDPCSEKVLLDGFGLSADLPEGDDVTVEFTPTEPGTYEFACQMGMLRGKLVVR